MTFHFIYRFAINGCQVCSDRAKQRRRFFQRKKSSYPQAPARELSSLDLPMHLSPRDKWMPSLFKPPRSEEEGSFSKRKAAILKRLQENRVSLTFRCIYRFAINGCQVCSSRRETKKEVLSAKEKRLLSQESSRKNQCAVLSAFSRLSAYKSSYSTMRLMVSVNSKYCSRLA